MAHALRSLIRIRGESPSPPDDAEKASEVSLGDDFKCFFFRHEIGYDLTQPAIFILERPHLRDLAGFHAAELGLQLVERVRIDAVLPADIFGADAGIVLFDDANDLRITKPGASRSPSGGFYASKTALSAGILPGAQVRDRARERRPMEYPTRCSSRE
jgi:hypothetical protein